MVYMSETIKMVYGYQCPECKGTRIKEYKGELLPWIRAMRRSQGWKNVDNTQMMECLDCENGFSNLTAMRDMQ